MTLTEFGTVRLAEDEAAAKETADADAEFWSDIKGDGTHFARHDPARALREVEAGRKILELHQPRMLGRWQVCSHCRPVDPEFPDDLTSEPWPCRTLRTQLAVYSDHADYDPDWRP